MLDELVAGLLEPLEDTVDGRRERARIEVEEEAGLAVPLGAITPLGAPLWVSPGVLPEVLHVFAADATHATPIPARGDGSPFETIAATRWTPLDEAIAGASEGEGVADLRAEVGLRRLAARLGRGSR
jgi:8-oxo-dGTP pyrophosphatase MutT (NUDIX family)